MQGKNQENSPFCVFLRRGAIYASMGTVFLKFCLDKQMLESAITKRGGWAIAPIAFCFFSSMAFTGSLTEDLSADELAQAKSGKLIVKTEDVDQAPLPRVKVYTWSKASTQVMDEVFRDYPNSHKYVPGVVKAEIVKKEGNDVYIVTTTSKIPIVGNTETTVKNTFQTTPNAVTVKWHLIESTGAEKADGQLMAEECDGGSLIRYTNFLVPKITLGASAIRGVAIQAVEKNVSAIKTESERRSK